MTETNLDIIKKEQRHYKAEWRKKNREHLRQYNKEWREKNKDKLAKYNNSYWLKKAQERKDGEKNETITN